MTIDISTCLKLKFGTYLILEGAYMRGWLIFEREFVLVSRGAYIWDFMVYESDKNVKKSRLFATFKPSNHSLSLF